MQSGKQHKCSFTTCFAGLLAEQGYRLLTHYIVMQIALVGVNAKRDGNGNLEMHLINLEHFRVPSDDVMMTTTTCTPEGRIFLGGNDGHLYELDYRNRNSWLKGRCNKVSHAHE